MTEGWGMVAAAAIALMGVFSGLFIGRRQVRDQAQVEHGQWLRGQRQEAFVQLIAAWDEAITKVETSFLKDEEQQYIDQTGQWEEAHISFLEGEENQRRPLRRAAEQVQMLGPESVDTAVTAMLGTVEQLYRGLEQQYALEGGTDSSATYWAARSTVDACRETFVAAARDALRQTPDTKRP